MLSLVDPFAVIYWQGAWIKIQHQSFSARIIARIRSLRLSETFSRGQSHNGVCSKLSGPILPLHRQRP